MADKKRTPDDIFDDMTETRAENNPLWVGLARLAAKHAPKEARILIAGILQRDSTVRNQWMELLDALDDTN